MKGLEWKTLLGIIFLIILLILIVGYFIGPIWGTGEGVTHDINFRFYCTVWAKTGYRGKEAVMEHGPNENMDPHCTRALGIDCATPDTGCMPGDSNDQKWKQCKAMCRSGNFSE